MAGNSSVIYSTINGKFPILLNFWRQHNLQGLFSHYFSSWGKISIKSLKVFLSIVFIRIIGKAYSAAVSSRDRITLWVNLPWKNLSRQNNWQGLFCRYISAGRTKLAIIMLQKNLTAEYLAKLILPLYFCQQNKFGNYYAAKKFDGRITVKVILPLCFISRQNNLGNYYAAK